MKWGKNIENIAKGKSPGKCPYCGSENTDYNCTIVIPVSYTHLDVYKRQRLYLV